MPRAIVLVLGLTAAACGSSSSSSSPATGSDAGDGATTAPADGSSPIDGAPGRDAAVDATATDGPSGDAHPEAGSQEAGADGGAGGLAYMVGIKTNGAPTGPAKVEAWLGRPLDVAGTTITTTSYIGGGTPYTTTSGAYPLLECSFPLLSIFGESNDLNDMAQAASGAYDSTYVAMAKALAGWKNPLLSVRVG
jgi:hypothetical protein